MCYYITNIIYFNKWVIFMYIARFYEKKEQPLKEHLVNVSAYAKSFAKNLNLENCLTLCGFLHDIGKYSDDFQNYIREEQKNAALGIKSNQKKVDHAVYGAKLVYKMKDVGFYNKITADIISEAICYHHGGLPDNVSDDRTVSLIERMNSVDENKYSEVLTRFFEDNSDFDMEKIQLLFKESINEIKDIISANPKKEYISLLIKNIYSMLVDADRWDSYLFTVDYESTDNFDIRKLWKEYDDNLQKKLLEFKRKLPETPLEAKVKSTREAVSECCRSFAENSTGIYNLTVPTGGGKTLSSLNYALNHAIKYGKNRIIYVIPYTSIIEQNAEEVRKTLHAENTLLEYHSNIMDCNKNENYEIFSERWTSPVIFTTMVQFLNCVYAKGNDNIRRMHNLENAVIIFDEIQTLPIKCINLFYTLIAYLRDVCKTTSVLCTATQPNLADINDTLGISFDGEIISDRNRIFSDLKRMEVIDKTQNSMTYGEASDFIYKVKSNTHSVLTVVNTVSSAENLYRNVKDRLSCKVYLLTSRMCPAHRKDTLRDVKHSLEEKQDVVCISTQLIEAGVDISFESVIRSLAGLDSIAQAIGRGNRHGEKAIGYGYIISLKDEKVGSLPEISIGQSHTRNILSMYAKSKEKFDNSLLSEKAMKRYYEEYFGDGEIEKNMSYPVKDNRSIFAMLRNSNVDISEFNGKYPLKFWSQFRTACENFSVIDENTETVVVPYDDKAKKLIGELLSDSVFDKGRVLRSLQSYTVNLYSNMIRILREQDAFGDENNYGVYILKDIFYSYELGVNSESNINAEENMF